MRAQTKSVIGGLRVLLSTICIAGLALFSLMWVRSSSWNDNIIGPQTGSFRPQISSADGWVTIRYHNDQLSPGQFPKWTRQSRSDEQMEAVYKQMEESIKNEPGATFTRPMPTFNIGWQKDDAFRTPYWLPILTLALLAMAFGWRQDWRFSIKTLLMWISIAALCLGLIVQFFRI